jgi:hypothetical protein
VGPRVRIYFPPAASRVRTRIPRLPAGDGPSFRRACEPEDDIDIPVRESGFEPSVPLPSLMLRYRGWVIASGAGLLAYRELDDTLKC